MKKHETEWLENQEACDEAVEWLKGKSLKRAWETCGNGDWMMWLVARCEHDRPTLVLCTCECARLVLANVPDGEDRPRIAIETAEAWTRGEATVYDCKLAANAALDAAVNADDAAWAAFYAAKVVVYTASVASRAVATSASRAASYARAAYYASYAYAAHAAAFEQCADVVRKYFPETPVIPGGKLS